MPREDIEAAYGPILRDPALGPADRVTRYFRALTDDHAGRDVTELAELLIEAWEGAAMRGKLDRSRAVVEQGFRVAVVKDATAGPALPEGDGYLAALVDFRFLAHAVWTTEEALAKLGAVTVPA